MSYMPNLIVSALTGLTGLALVVFALWEFLRR